MNPSTRYAQIVVCSLMLLTLACKATARANGDDRSPQSARTFVQEFYGWYVPQALDEGSAPAWKRAIEHRGDALGSELAAALKNDLEAQEKVAGEIVGLDFDPFLSSQDPCERYDVGTVREDGSGYRVNIHGVCAGTRNAQPDVSAEVERQGGHWVLVNVHYPDGKDLLSTLKLLSEGRAKL
jgi:hypothetical protein